MDWHWILRFNACYYFWSWCALNRFEYVAFSCQRNIWRLINPRSRVITFKSQLEIFYLTLDYHWTFVKMCFKYYDKYSITYYKTILIVIFVCISLLTTYKKNRSIQRQRLVGCLISVWIDISREFSKTKYSE